MTLEQNTYSLETQDILVEVVPLYVPEQDQFEGQHLYTYNISITNQSKQKVQLLSRHWIIVDGHGRREDVKGDGVVGEQPTIEPGGTYQYSSYCPLATPTGSMRGNFFFVDELDQPLQVGVPLFFLRPDAVLQ